MSQTTPAFMTQAGYEHALEQLELERQRWKRVEEKMKRQHEEMVADWKRKDDAYVQATSETSESDEKIEKDHIEIKKYSQQEIDEAVRQIRMDRLKILLNPYVY